MSKTWHRKKSYDDWESSNSHNRSTLNKHKNKNRKKTHYDIDDDNSLAFERNNSKKRK